MTDLRQAAQQALEAMDDLHRTGDTQVFDLCHRETTEALRAALAEHDKKLVWVEERKAHWAEQLQLARETQERERQQREEDALTEQGCDHCRHVLYAATKCKNCGRVTE